MSDPFVLLQVGPDATPAEIAKAMAQAPKRGVPMAEARKAFDRLRDPARRETAALLAASQTPTARSLDAREPEADAEEARRFVLSVLGVLVAAAEQRLQAPDVLPQMSVTRDVRDYAPAPMEEIQP